MGCAKKTAENAFNVTTFYLTYFCKHNFAICVCACIRANVCDSARVCARVCARVSIRANVCDSARVCE